MTDISVLKITPAKKKQLEDVGINTLEDLLKYFPKDYLDFTKESEVSIMNVNKNVLITGILYSVQHVGPNKNIIKAEVQTSTGMSLTVIWFNQEYIYNKLNFIKGCRVVVCGKLTKNDKYRNSSAYQITNPIIFSRSLEDSKKILPVYKKIPGMSMDYLTGLIAEARKKVSAKEYLPEDVKREFKLCNYETLFDKIHSPKSQEDISASKRRLIFDDMFYYANELYNNASSDENSSFVIKKHSIVNDVIKSLPYKLTEDQSAAVSEIYNICSSGKVLDALIQGDVGSGKTIIAFLSMFLFAENGYQSVLLAPTQVLANQHYLNLSELSEKFGFKTVLLKQGIKAKELKNALAAIADGSAQFIVGTHAVFSEAVTYNNLALAITDEEHKFGVTQREAIKNRCSAGINCISMSATPIPRSLALTLYGVNKQVITISQMPSGRKPVKTIIENRDEKINKFMLEKIKLGQQCYVVCPFVNPADRETCLDVESTTEVYEKMCNWFNKNAPNINISVVTGRMKSADVESEINTFVNGDSSILIATTVIEVGVNVPNSNVIVVKNAERFGLAQLHQLRGRVGRGNAQGYCILQSKDWDNERLSVMTTTTNGFEIAEADMKQRGAGALVGTAQSGVNKYVNQIMLYPKFFNNVKECVKRLNQKNLTKK